MRFSLYVLSMLLAVGTFAYLATLAREGQQLRSEETAAARDAENILRLQEGRRERQVSASEPVRFASLEELTEEEGLAGFEIVDRGLTYQVARHGDYMFRLSLLSGDATSGAPLPSQRYELWAWPADPAERSQVLFYGNNSGYLIQGENGETAGPTDRPLDVQPLRELEAEKNVTGMRRWTVLVNVREPAAAESPAAQR